MTRTALLIRCDKDEAERIRVEASNERCTISDYVLRISLRAVADDDRLFSRLNQDYLTNRPRRSTSPRTAILARCDISEGERIREAARRREIPINAFVLQALKHAWDSPLRPPSAPSHQPRNQSTQVN
jgi:uncharacterized protein (DUF1778 family)